MIIKKKFAFVNETVSLLNVQLLNVRWAVEGDGRIKTKEFYLYIFWIFFFFTNKKLNKSYFLSFGYSCLLMQDWFLMFHISKAHKCAIWPVAQRLSCAQFLEELPCSLVSAAAVLSFNSTGVPSQRSTAVRIWKPLKQLQFDHMWFFSWNTKTTDSFVVCDVTVYLC